MTQQAQRPNIVWIMTDDLSWGDLGCYGQQKIKTPNIDRLAAEGVKFGQCYSGASLCAPARSSLMQGLHQGHATVRENMVRTSAGNVYRHSLEPQDTTVAAVLKQAGYATGMFGKWGLSLFDQPGIPENKGYDRFFGYLNQRHAHSYYPSYLWENNRRVPLPQNEGHNHTKPNAYDARGRIVVNGVKDSNAATYSFDLYAEKSIEFVRANKDKPFFLYLPYTIPHGVLAVPDLGEYAPLDWPSVTHKVWAAMISRMDAAVGTLMSTLRELGLDENTLVFFTSDNGYSAESYGPDRAAFDEFFKHRGPWAGRKGNLRQGGVRVPMVARWPGHIRPGTVSDQIWAFYDFLPTAAEAAGAPAPAGIDGISILPALLGQPRRQRQREYLYWEFHDEQALRLGDWYVYRPHPDKPIEVHHANDDPQAQHDLAAQKPDVVKRAAEIFRAEHRPSLYSVSPGESHAAWENRLQAAGIELPNNVDG